ncbi:hypothetical protein PMAYCL1PPCAC_21595 [Pristionchus mayeri]|uniref:Kal-1 n=1 Tax=Pristionchus mayeri TaxID=1317129 RepID=A0AAN5CW45_9BILA|nr:hypothetical protein PMAYCL1PPCAC_21595 [Pristionchus mayeri]
MAQSFCMILLLLLLPLVSSDELISVRCQAKCLHNLETKHQKNAEIRRAMKHHVVSVCGSDEECSACTNPCSESFEDLESCTSSFCAKLEGDRARACHESCLFLQHIYSEKPGQCPSFESLSTVNECAASCHLDGDCPETAKCCSVGCSRRCLQPEKNSSVALLPVPSGISATERKRRRSALLRWNIRKLSKKQANTLSNLFVVQWRWGLSETAMGGWQTLLIKNKMSAILKHLLSPGRLYQFRVAAVSVDGSLGFSSPSVPFKLSKEPNAPASPTVMLGTSRLMPSGLWSLTVQWTVPTSDLPIKNYEVSWEESTQEEASSFEGRVAAALKRNADDEEDDSLVDGLSLGGFGGRALRKATVVPSHHTSIVIEGLAPMAVYLVEVHATVDSSEGEIHGEKGVLFITTSSLSAAEEEHEPVKKHGSEPKGTLHVGTPHIEKDKLVASVNWIDTKICTRRGSYTLRLRKNSCGDTKVDGDWEERLLSSCSTVVDGLEHGCSYEVAVHPQSESDQVISSSFSTPSCPSPSSCLPSSPLSCSVQSFVVLCHWPHAQHNSQESTIGYRVSLTSDDAKTSQISILPPQTPETTFQDLRSGVEYTLEVQPITSRGIGSAMTTRFRSPLEDDDDEMRESEESMINHMDGGEIIELPLESGARSIFCTLTVMLLACIL